MRGKRIRWIRERRHSLVVKKSERSLSQSSLLWPFTSSHPPLINRSSQLLTLKHGIKPTAADCSWSSSSFSADGDWTEGDARHDLIRFLVKSSFLFMVLSSSPPSSMIVLLFLFLFHSSMEWDHKEFLFFFSIIFSPSSLFDMFWSWWIFAFIQFPPFIHPTSSRSARRHKTHRNPRDKYRRYRKMKRSDWPSCSLPFWKALKQEMSCTWWQIGVKANLSSWSLLSSVHHLLILRGKIKKLRFHHLPNEKRNMISPFETSSQDHRKKIGMRRIGLNSKSFPQRWRHSNLY